MHTLLDFDGNLPAYVNTSPMAKQPTIKEPTIYPYKKAV
jgi:hypothetical protein